MEMKVVCIVQNINNERDTGLNHVFEGFNNSFVEKYLFEQTRNSFTTKLGNLTNYLLISKETVSLEENLSPEKVWEIIFVSDSVEVKNYPKCLCTPETMVMYHSTPKNSEAELNKKGFKIIKQGEHEPNGQGYPRLRKLIEAWDNEKNCFDEAKYKEALDNIIAWFEANDELEQKLELLHKCLTPEDAASCIVETENNWNLIETFSLLNSINIDNSTIGDYINSSFIGKSDCFDEENYIKPLRKLRDALLL